MVRNLLFTALIFALGVGVGSIALGQRDGSAPVLSSASTETEAQASRQPQPDGTNLSTSPDEDPSFAAAETDTSADAEVIEVEIGPASPAERRILAIETRWSSLSSRLDTLSRRVVSLERQLAERDAGDIDDELASQALPIDTPEDRRSALIFAGVDRRIAEDIVLRESDLAMERLDLRDRAAREGWLESERYFEELNALNERAIDLRSEVGDAAFDRFLYETGQPNRVAVSSVMSGSQGELAGLLPGDIIEDYAGEPVFDFNDLRSATTAGTRDETVPVTIRRDDSVIETWIARGPIGVTLQADSASPNW
jgi:hypothetical protein